MSAGRDGMGRSMKHRKRTIASHSSNDTHVQRRVKSKLDDWRSKEESEEYRFNAFSMEYDSCSSKGYPVGAQSTFSARQYITPSPSYGSCSSEGRPPICPYSPGRNLNSFSHGDCYSEEWKTALTDEAFTAIMRAEDSEDDSFVYSSDELGESGMHNRRSIKDLLQCFHVWK